LLITSKQSEATQNLVSPRSCASASPSRHATASRVAGFRGSVSVKAEAPINCPISFLHTTATAPPAPYLEVAASTFNLVNPTGGAIHLSRIIPDGFVDIFFGTAVRSFRKF
jgi:hypothetical protein